MSSRPPGAAGAASAGVTLEPGARRLHVVALVKQVPRFETMELGPDGRLLRAGRDLELNPYCRRAVSAAVELARSSGGTCTVVTLGPPAAEDCLREAIAWGADRGVLVSDPAFAGSDTLATSRALAAALRRLPPADLVLAGRNSVDADTAQVPGQLAEILGLPFLGGARELRVTASGIRVRCERDDGWVTATAPLPALLSCAERLCEPAKVDAGGRAAVDAGRITRLGAGVLGPGPWGQEGSPTRVGETRRLAVTRLRAVLDGDLDAQVCRAVDLLVEHGAVGPPRPERAAALLPPSRGRGGPVVGVVVEPDRGRSTREQLGAAARLAAQLGGRVTALSGPGLDAAAAGGWGADTLACYPGALVEEDVAEVVASWCRAAGPWAVLAPSTMWGREVAARASARLGAGLVGDAVDLDVRAGRLVAWKPAFGGGLVAAVTCSSPLQMATVRPGVLGMPAERAAVAEVQPLAAAARSRVRVLERWRDDDLDVLATARRVVIVGAGVPADAYPSLQPLLDALGAELAGTRKVTDRGWMPRSRQVGLTGRAIAPDLVVELGASGKFNHAVGVRAAGFVLAVNSDPAAPVFESADAGIVAGWQEVVPRLAAEIRARTEAAAAAGGPAHPAP